MQVAPGFLGRRAGHAGGVVDQDVDRAEARGGLDSAVYREALAKGRRATRDEGINKALADRKKGVRNDEIAAYLRLLGAGA